MKIARATIVANCATRAGRPGSRFTLYHGLAISLALHAALSLPYFLSRSAPEEDEQSTLVFEMDGLVSDEQADETVQQDTAGQTQQTAQAAAQAQQTPPQEQQPIEDDGAPVQANTVVAAGEAGARRGHKGEWRRGATDRPHDRAS
ncbi:hypothetical+protein [Methylocapsa aurea]|uniref:hypothetical protein n=1 Tax=Methylocapsa aurea TaxID=663610 RepID=UPI003D18D21E